MQGVILATGERNALASISGHVPAALLPIVERPAVALAVEQLARGGIRDILVGLYRQGECIEAYLGNGRRWCVNIQYALHRQLPGSAGVLRRAGTRLHETLVVVPADAVLDLDIAAAVAQHRQRHSIATVITCAPCASVEGWTGNRVRVDDQGRVATDQDAPGSRLLICPGAYILEPRALDAIPSQDAPDIGLDLIPVLIARHERVDVYEMGGYWNPLDSLAAYHSAQRACLDMAWSTGRHGSDAKPARAHVQGAIIHAPQIAPGVWIGKNHAIHPSVSIAPPIYVGDNCLIGRDVALGPYAVVGKNAIVDDEATVRDSAILPNTYVGRLVNVEGHIVNMRTLCDPRTSETTQVVDEFLLSEVKPRLTGDAAWRLLNGAVALLLLVIALPALAFAGLAALACSGGRIIRRLPRITSSGSGESQRVFDLLRFETRGRGGEQSAPGLWLEWLELDRLPELFNAITGDLRLVGVKPLTQEQAKRVVEEWQQKRFERPAGITGLWYVRTSAGATLEDVLVADAYYAATHTWRDDVVLLCQTPLAWLRRHRALH